MINYKRIAYYNSSLNAKYFKGLHSVPFHQKTLLDKGVLGFRGGICTGFVYNILHKANNKKLDTTFINLTAGAGEKFDSFLAKTISLQDSYGIGLGNKTTEEIKIPSKKNRPTEYVLKKVASYKTYALQDDDQKMQELDNLVLPEGTYELEFYLLGFHAWHSTGLIIEENRVFFADANRGIKEFNNIKDFFNYLNLNNYYPANELSYLQETSHINIYQLKPKDNQNTIIQDKIDLEAPIINQVSENEQIELEEPLPVKIETTISLNDKNPLNNAETLFKEIQKLPNGRYQIKKIGEQGTIATEITIANNQISTQNPLPFYFQKSFIENQNDFLAVAHPDAGTIPFTLLQEGNLTISQL